MVNSSELAARIYPIAGGKLPTVTRQLQRWVEQAVVPPAGPVHVGYGRQRSYGDESMLLAGIAAALSRWTKETDLIRLIVSTLISRELRPNKKWHGDSGRLQAIIAGRLDALLVVQHGDERDVTYFFIRREEMAEFLSSDEFGGHGCGALILDLSRLWRTVGGLGFQPQSAQAISAALEG